MADEEDPAGKDPSNVETFQSAGPIKSRESSLNRIRSQTNSEPESATVKSEASSAIGTAQKFNHPEIQTAPTAAASEKSSTMSGINVKQELSQDQQIEKPSNKLTNTGAKSASQAPRSTERRRTQRRFRELLGKRELRNVELEKREGDLRGRLDLLECSMPAVMVWNIWRMAQGAPVSSIQRAMEKQLRSPSGEAFCPSTPSRHYDCRVREVEAERKLAQKRAEEARSLWTAKSAELEDRKSRLEEARRIQEERKRRIEQLSQEAEKLRKALETVESDGVCEAGECGDIECKRRLLSKLPSASSIGSTDLECLEKLESLAEAELSMKRQIEDLERREEAYMRSLQQADELWSRVEGDTASTLSAVQEQLEGKVAANQRLADRIRELEDELEGLRMRMAKCKQELEKFLSVEKIEAAVGREDDLAEVSDKAAAVRVKVEHRRIGGEDDLATVQEKEVLAKGDVVDEGTFALIKDEVVDKETLASIKDEVVDEETLASIKEEVLDEETLASIKEEMLDEETLASIKEEMLDEETLASIKEEVIDKETLATAESSEVGTEASVARDDKMISATPDVVDSTVDRPTDLLQVDHVQVEIRPEDLDREEQRLKEVGDYLAMLGSPEELDYDDDYGVCAPDFYCNDQVFTKTGMDDEELAALELSAKSVTFRMSPMEGQKGSKTASRITDVDSEARGRFDELEDEELRVEDLEASVKTADEEEASEEVQENIEEETVQFRGFPDEKVSAAPLDSDTVTETFEREEEEAEGEINFGEVFSKETDVTARISEYQKSAESVPADGKNVLLPRHELLSWLNTVNSIRSVIVKCPECRTAKPNAEMLAGKIAATIGVTVSTTEDEEGSVLLSIEELEAKEPEETTTDATSLGMPRDKSGISRQIGEATERDAIATESDSGEAKSAVPVEPTEVPAEPEDSAIDYETREAPSRTEEAGTKIPSEFQDIDAQLSVEDAAKTLAESPPTSPSTRTAGGNYVDEISMSRESADEMQSQREYVAEVPTTDTPEAESGRKLQEGEEEIAVEVLEDVETELEELPVDEVREITVEGVEVPEDDVEMEVSEVDERLAETREATAEITDVEPPGSGDQETKEEDAGVIEVQKQMESAEEAKAEEITAEESEKETVEVSLKSVRIEEEVESILQGQETEEVPEEILKVDVEEMEDLAVEKDVSSIKGKIPKDDTVSTEKEMQMEEPAKQLERIEEDRVAVADEKMSVQEEMASVMEEEPSELMEKAPGLIESQVMARPYLAVAGIDERQEDKEIREAARPKEIPCTCKPLVHPLPEVPATIKKLELTQPETSEIVTQTASSVQTQTLPAQRIVRRMEPSKLIAITRTIDQRVEVSDRLARWRQRHRDQSTVITVTGASQTEKSSVPRGETKEATGRYLKVPISDLLRNVKTQETPTDDRERELRSISYARGPEEPEKLECTCCLCGKTERTRADNRPAIGPGVISTAASTLKRSIGAKSPKTERERLCLDCKIKRLERGRVCPPAEATKTTRIGKSTHDREACTASRPRPRIPCGKRPTEKRDQCCMAKIPRPRIASDRQGGEESFLENEKSVTESFDKKSLSRDEDAGKDSLTSCVCYEIIGTDESGPRKVPKCTCGDSD